LALHKFENATAGGDWIIQECLKNNEFVSKLVPSNAPLSTFRLVTASRGGLARLGKYSNTEMPQDLITVLSCVFRAGRAGATTDHKAVQFDVNMEIGKIRNGFSNAHWYHRGMDALWECKWTNPTIITRHPDTTRVVSGTDIPEFGSMVDLVRRAHELIPNVPFCGWDVALTDKGTLLLETNLSCNFFQASFDRDEYFDIVNGYFELLDPLKSRFP
jgi:hypothetical protein